MLEQILKKKIVSLQKFDSYLNTFVILQTEYRLFYQNLNFSDTKKVIINILQTIVITLTKLFILLTRYLGCGLEISTSMNNKYI